MADIMLNLVKHIVGTKYENLTAEAIDYAKKSILDTMAVTIAGSGASGCKEVVELVREWGGKEESTIWIFGGKVPANLAGLAIGPMARVWDYGDILAAPIHESDLTAHVTEYIVPAAFPVVERQGGIDGKEFITAVALGQDILCRIQQSMVMPPDHAQYCLSAIFGPAATIAKLLRFDEETTWHTMGLAFSQASGEMQGYTDGTLSQRLHHGFVADAAIKAALLARKGLTGPRNILQGKFNFYRTFGVECNTEPLTSGLGENFEGAFISIKPYPACAFTHGAVEATVDCVRAHNIKAEEVEEIEVGVGRRSHYYVCEPAERKNNPLTVVDCQLSLPYQVATAIVQRRFLLEDLSDEARKRADVQKTIKKIKTTINDEVVPKDNPMGGGSVRIRTKDGKEYSRQVLYPKGHPKSPMTMDDVIEKFRQCFPLAARSLPEKNGEEIIKMVSHLEQVGDVGKIVELLVP